MEELEAKVSAAARTAFVEEMTAVHCLNTLFSKLQIVQSIIFCVGVKASRAAGEEDHRAGAAALHLPHLGHYRYVEGGPQQLFHDFRNGRARPPRRRRTG